MITDPIKALETAKEVFEDLTNRAKITKDFYVEQRARCAAESIRRIIKESKTHG